eukprot:584974-Pelagomonas_calceolata.AAC.1
MLAVGADKVAWSRLRRRPVCLCLFWDVERGCGDGTACVEEVLFGWEPARGLAMSFWMEDVLNSSSRGRLTSAA